jgi:hypothetical protein
MMHADNLRTLYNDKWNCAKVFSVYVGFVTNIEF